MYGRVGVAWNPQNGRYVHGKSLNLLGTLGGRLEEGDYLEPTIKLNIVKPTAEDNTKPYFHVVLTPSMFSTNGSFIGAFANNFSTTLRIELFQAYLEAGNVLIPDLKIWAGQRFYRGSDVHIADYFFFNNLSSQGFGVKYKALDVAVLLQTGTSTLYSSRADDGNPDTTDPLFQRQRTVLVGQYVLPVAEKHSLHLLGEFHLLPANRAAIGSTALAPTDIGYVAGVKFRADLGNGSFSETAVRAGGGIANGAYAGSSTWGTYGLTNEDGKYAGALGLEFVEHFLYNVNPLFTVNAFAIVQRSQGASGESQDHALNFATGARTFLYLHNQFHLINELTFQGVSLGQPEGAEKPSLPYAVKFSIVPTLVPSGDRSAWARPHLRLIYTLAYYGEGAREAASAGTLSSAYMREFGPRTFGHYLGARAEWWF
ncbi:carbohydrate porin [Hyalangium minutum]|uniref:carbohydrate porin n=1 Tax=Hyalangium minutum TaxID=394096 RepID=UPI0005C6866B|nr:carbohydrate porin [Hyalangium minutum]